MSARARGHVESPGKALSCHQPGRLLNGTQGTGLVLTPQPSWPPGQAAREFLQAAPWLSSACNRAPEKCAISATLLHASGTLRLWRRRRDWEGPEQNRLAGPRLAPVPGGPCSAAAHLQAVPSHPRGRAGWRGVFPRAGWQLSYSHVPATCRPQCPAPISITSASLPALAASSPLCLPAALLLLKAQPLSASAVPSSPTLLGASSSAASV